MKRWGLVSLIAMAILITAVVILAMVKFEGDPPQVVWEPAAPQILGLENNFKITVTDQGQGLKSLRLTLAQGGAEKVLAEQTWPGQMGLVGSGVHRATVDVQIPVKKLGLKDGPATLTLLVRDHAWRESFHGNKAELVKQLLIDTVPPAVTLSSRQNYLNLGGCGLAVFRASEEVRAGVNVGDKFFPALALEKAGKGAYAVLYALPWDTDRKVDIDVVAQDLAGNKASLRLPVQIKPRKWPVSKMNIPKSFLETKMPEFRQHYPDLPADDLEAYLEVNRKFRDQNNQTIRQATGAVTPQRLWSGPFLQLKNSQRTASFADQRTYYYEGREIDHQVHLGLDLASLANAEVPAANRGKVAFAGYLGIYGNTVILDHGQGLFTLYGHLSTIAVTKEQMADKGQTLGQTGTTGLAGGDHLHYSVICHGYFVDPVEWYDNHWIEDNILSKENAAAQGG